MKSKKIALASDHAGFRIKEKLVKFLTGEGYETKDFGCFSEESVDYPDYAHPAVAAVEAGKYDLGITVCGSGNGINMTANKYPGIRSALCWNEEISFMARAHNDANVCAIPGRYLSESEAILIVKTFLNTEFDGGRHQKRIDKIPLKRI
ncbi:MAG: ribose 5-phosphate isomerase B [Clostridia bacterium]|nr:ribose 5-phosphate isomerase B [Clostridia bacterium]